MLGKALRRSFFSLNGSLSVHQPGFIQPISAVRDFSSKGSSSGKKPPSQRSQIVRRRNGSIYPSKDNQAEKGVVSESLSKDDDVENDLAENQEIAFVLKAVAQNKIPTPEQSIILPHDGRPIFPGFNQIYPIKNRAVAELLGETLDKHNKAFGSLFLKKDFSPGIEVNPENKYKLDDFYTYGSFVEILSIEPIEHKTQHGTKTFMSGSQANLEEDDITTAKIVDKEFKSATEWSALIKCHHKVTLSKLLNEQEPLEGKIAHLSEPKASAAGTESPTHQALRNSVATGVKDLAQANPLFRDHIRWFSQRFSGVDSGQLADFSASLTSATPHELQEVLEAIDVEKRLQLVLNLLAKEHKLSDLQKEINREVEKSMSENQRKFMLTQQLKQIEKELGITKDDKEELIKKFESRIANFNVVEEKEEEKIKVVGELPEEAMKVIEDELNKLRTLEKNSSEYNMTRNYLDWLTYINWTKFSIENFDVVKAKKQLDLDHYGLKDVKERILEYIAVGNLRDKISGKIILLVGPPGVGKTSIGKSIATSLGREFFRFSVGGLGDVSEIKGHRRTYVGAMPGKIVQALKSAKTMNPLILIDEIDKLSHGTYRGDPSSALLELLDPSQNTSFVDHYLDVPLDVSKVLFVCTANEIDSIPGPLLDRLEVIRLSGYDLPEKVRIAKDYLEPRAKEDGGIKAFEEQENAVPKKIELSEDALKSLARWYNREAGVRRLQQHIEKIYRKVAYLLVKRDTPQDAGEDVREKGEEEEVNKIDLTQTDEENRYVIKPDMLEKFIGKAPFRNERLYEELNPAGVVLGLAWTSMGGATLYIETTAVQKADSDEKTEGSGAGFSVTGQLGDVMKESTALAMVNAKRVVYGKDPRNSFFQDNFVHLHVPEGATPKDGPSAGITMTTALVSLALGKKVPADLAMTGEISLTGVVLPVGGIKEKIIAARRVGTNKIILPFANQKDFEELPKYLKEGIDIHFAKEYKDVFDLVF